jgi:carbon-monoxide dehydrogenase medium subunit
MKAAPFSYQRPVALPDALGALADAASSAISGGQSLGPMLNLRLARPPALVDIRRLEPLRASRIEDGRLHLGAAVTHAEIEDGLVPDTTRGMLPQVARGIAYRAIRNRGTLGGSLAHCDPAADWLNCLLALGARLHLASAGGRRTLMIEDFARGAYSTALAAGEILVSVELPAFTPALRWGYYKICAKVGEFADAIGAVVVDPDIGHCRLVIGAVETRPVLVPDPSSWIDGSRAAGVETFEALIAQTFPAQDPIFIHRHAVAMSRAIAQMAARAS